MGPKLFFEVNFAFFCKLAFSHCNSQYTGWSNYNGKMPTFRKMQNSPQNIILAPVLNSLCLKGHMQATFTKKQKILSPPHVGARGPRKPPKTAFFELSGPFYGKTTHCRFFWTSDSDSAYSNQGRKVIERSRNKCCLNLLDSVIEYL